MPEESAEELLSRIDTNVPHPARVWDYWLGGKDNYPADRAVGEEILSVMPELVVNARAEREFLGRAVRHLAADVGIRQFLDIGTGIPAADNTHQVAQSVAPDAKVVYVDNDPIVLVHARALLAGTPEGVTSYVDADLRDPDRVLEEAGKSLDFSEPITLMMLGVLEFIPDSDQARTLVTRLVDSLAPGSHVMIAQSVRSPSMDEAAQRWNDSGATPIALRTPDEVSRFFDGLELLDPGLVSLPQWRPGPGTLYAGREVFQYGGVARKS
ncbi:SAM-dependent methyltransferase [Spirillospora sp. NPDC047279]|uniref:SAM-dependent methyltransferase n=1 Tax=Spirillospora sp. NPDC047279 TaxID=3155478 RepID=UPI0033E9359B